MGVWIETYSKNKYRWCCWVTPCMGVWIETIVEALGICGSICHTLYGCVDWNIDRNRNKYLASRVTPCMGVWIETRNQDNKQRILRVTPCMGVWIETTCQRQVLCGDGMSHPVWVCGLKHLGIGIMKVASEVTPCMGVWIETGHPEAEGTKTAVTPCMGVWIETSMIDINPIVNQSHTLYGCVDWNTQR